jgi:two-component system LytT family sensor kinase
MMEAASKPAPARRSALKAVVSCRRPLSHNALFWVLQTGGWIAAGVVTFGFLLAKETRTQATFDVILFVVTGFLLTSLYRYPYRRWRRLETSLPALAVWIAICGTVGVPLWYEPQAFLTRVAAIDHPNWVSELPTYEIPLDCWLWWGSTLYSWSFLYFGINYWISLQAERRRAAAAEVSAQAARLRALQSQLQPHFLFNTLNSISALILDGRSDTAVSMIGQLGELLRLSLQTSDMPQIPLEKELYLVRCYLAIEKTRFGDRLQYRLDIAPSTANAMVPTLLLQPLVENAVHHGIMPLARGGTISIVARIDGASLRLRVEDDGRGTGVMPAARLSGIGLANSIKRLDELFGERARLEFGPGSAGGVAVDITLPLVHQSLSAGAEPQPPVGAAEPRSHREPPSANPLPRLT